MKILIVDDDPTSLKILEVIAKSLGYEVVCATSAEQAWQLYSAAPVRIVISDWIMPGMHGPDLCRQIRAHQSDYYTYFILVTSRSDRESLLAGFEAGADDFLSKPVDRDELRARTRSGERVVALETQLADKLKELGSAYGHLKKDLQAAASIQQALLPNVGIDVPNCRVAWHVRPCEELAGDILNYFMIGEHFLGFYVIDVSGHGVAASLWSVTLSKQLLPIPGQSVLLGSEGETVDGHIQEPAAVLGRLNSQYQISEETRGQYFTIVYCLLDLRNGLLRYAAAAHPSPVLARADGSTVFLEEGNVPIGFLAESAFSGQSVQLVAGDRIYLYSDGVPETASPSGEFLGSNGLLRVLQQTRAAPLQSSVDQVVCEVCDWCRPAAPADDVSIIAVEWCP